MAGTVSQNQVGSFTTPTNGTTGDADQVRSNDNTIRAAFNTHDADATIHVQSSTLASRPAAGTAGRVWVTTDSNVPRVWYDNGTTWYELDYLNQTQGGTVSGALTVDDTLAVNSTTTLNDNVTVTGTASDRSLTVNANAGRVRSVSWKTAGVARWSLFASSDAEGGSNAGSNLTLNAYNDAGVLIGSPLVITRSSLAIAIQSALTVSGGLTVSGSGAAITGNSTITGNLTVTGTVSGTITGVSTYDRATGDVSFTAATDLGLTFAIGATEVWEAEYVLVHTNAGVGSATAQFDIGVPASATGVHFAVGGDGSGSATGTVSQVVTSYASAITGMPAGAVAGNPGHVHIRATIIGGGTAGNVTITGTSSSGTGTLKAGSFVRATKLA